VTVPARTRPWKPGDTPAVLTLNALAAVSVLVCWIGSATEVRFHDTLYWLQGAIVAALVASVANGLWLLAGMRQLRARRRLLIETWPRQPASVASTREPDVVTAERMTTYHRPSCLLVSGKALRSGTRAALEGRHKRPCGMCQP
jgi:hypothetical protein